MLNVIYSGKFGNFIKKAAVHGPDVRQRKHRRYNIAHIRVYKWYLIKLFHASFSLRMV